MSYRAKMAKRLGHPLKADVIVHHIDGDRSNNDEHNLAVMTHRAHGRLHARERKLIAPTADPRPTIGDQIRAARALLGWKQSDLAKAAGISEITLKRLETGKSDVRCSTLNATRRALDEAGITFLREDDAVGVSLRKQP
jgi:DNA-binding XRE family transcriptional regulator